LPAWKLAYDRRGFRARSTRPRSSVLCSLFLSRVGQAANIAAYKGREPGLARLPESAATLFPFADRDGWLATAQLMPLAILSSTGSGWGAGAEPTLPFEESVIRNGHLSIRFALSFLNILCSKTIACGLGLRANRADKTHNLLLCLAQSTTKLPEGRGVLLDVGSVERRAGAKRRHRWNPSALASFESPERGAPGESGSGLSREAVRLYLFS